MRKVKEVKKSEPKRVHVARRVPVKFAEIDEGIMKVVEWLNSFDGIYTRWSCEGGHDDEPMVIFYCEDIADLTAVCRAVGYSGSVQAEYYNPKASLRYILRFRKMERTKSRWMSMSGLDQFLQWYKPKHVRKAGR